MQKHLAIGRGVKILDKKCQGGGVHRKLFTMNFTGQLQICFCLFGIKKKCHELKLRWQKVRRLISKMSIYLYFYIKNQFSEHRFAVRRFITTSPRLKAGHSLMV